MPSIRILSGKYKNRRLDFPLEKGLRPTSQRLRQSAFNSLIHRFLSHRIGHELPLEGLKVFDVFAGLGSYGFESLSLGAEHVTFIEKNFLTTRLIEGYVHQLGVLPRVRILCKIWPYAHPSLETFDLVFMDPPYETSPNLLSVYLESCAPLMTESSILILESPHLIESLPSLLPLFSKKNRLAYVTFFQKKPCEPERLSSALM
jgi:16S rRNA (guanine966-N2)-methyltransferase